MSIRLDVNLNQQCADAIRAYAAANSVTVTEATRRAISLLNLLDVEQQLGHRLAVVDDDGTVLKTYEATS
jgi:hypothetical protein